MKLKFLSPSNSHRWFVCGGSPWEASFAPIVDTEEERNISLEGSAAHKLLETSVTAKKHPLTFVGKMLKLTKPTAEWEATEDMGEHIGPGYDLILEKSKGGKLWLEQSVNIEVQGVQCGGTLDAGWYGQYDTAVDIAVTGVNPKKLNGKYKTKEWQLHLLDLKYGYKEVADPGENTQLRIYACALLRELMARNKPVDSIHMWIFQPRVDSAEGPFKHDVISVDDLHAFELELSEAVVRAKNPKAKRIPGEHCLHCGGLATCTVAEQATMRIFRRKYSDNDRKRIGELLFLRPQVTAWAKAVLALGNSMGLNNKPPIGWVMGNGRRSKRWQGDKQEWSKKIGPQLRKLGFKEDEYAPRKLVSPARAMAMLPKDDKNRAKVEKLWFWTQGKATLQPADNARNKVDMKQFFEEHDYGDETDNEE